MTRTGGATAFSPSPTADASTSSPTAGGDYTIERGDTLSALARKFGTSVDALVAANGIANPDLIIAGATLHIAGATSGGGSGKAVGAAGAPDAPAPTTGATGTAKGAGRITGKTSGLRPELMTGLDSLSRELNITISIISGNRTREEQQRLYEKYKKGAGNLAAVPGRSNHESGQAADAYVDGVPLASVPGAKRAAARLGLHFPVKGEAWHVEHV